jgi:hypothetical protein
MPRAPKRRADAALEEEGEGAEEGGEGEEEAPEAEFSIERYCLLKDVASHAEDTEDKLTKLKYGVVDVYGIVVDWTERRKAEGGTGKLEQRFFTFSAATVAAVIPAKETSPAALWSDFLEHIQTLNPKPYACHIAQ